MGLECRLVELRIAEGGEGRGPSLHGRNEALLAHDDGGDVAESGFPDEVQTPLRLAPHRVERIVPQDKDSDGSGHIVAGGGQRPRLCRGAKGRPTGLDRARDRLCPEGNYSHREVDFCLTGDEAVFLDQVASELGETIPVTVTVKDWPEDGPEIGTAERGRATHPLLRADVHHTAYEQAK